MRSRLLAGFLVSTLLYTSEGFTSNRVFGKITRNVFMSASQPGGGINVSDLRKDYSSKGLMENDINHNNPYELFSKWFDEACAANVLEPNAMCLSTCVNNKPSARYVLLKGHDERGFVWYTNYNSRKSKEIEENPNAAITFWWGDLERSIRIEGIVEKVSTDESDQYFQSRPRGSQIGAWSSNQSQIIENRDKLEEQERNIIKKFEGLKIIPRPQHWGGFRLVPSRIEFWKGRSSRLHDRVVFIKTNNKWQLERLQP